MAKPHTANLFYGEISVRWSVRTAEFPYDEISYGEISYGEISYGEISGNVMHVYNCTFLYKKLYIQKLYHFLKFHTNSSTLIIWDKILKA